MNAANNKIEATGLAIALRIILAINELRSDAF